VNVERQLFDLAPQSPCRNLQDDREPTMRFCVSVEAKKSYEHFWQSDLNYFALVALGRALRTS
jgi:hypothetical protein